MTTKIVDEIDLTGHKIVNLADPTADQHAATRAYVLAQIAAVGGVTLEDVRDAIAALITAGQNIDVTYTDDGANVGSLEIAVENLTASDVTDFSTAADARVTAVVTAAFINALSGVDADTLGGDSKATIIASAVAAIVDSAPTTLDTLNELAAALGDDPNYAATITTALGLRVQQYATTIGDGATTTFTITHNLGTRDVQVQVYEVADDYEQVWATVKRATTNTVTVTFGASHVPTTNQYRVVVQGRA